MKKIFTLASMVFCFGILFSAGLNAQQTATPVFEPGSGFKRCGQTEYENYLRSINPNYDQQKADNEKIMQRTIAAMEAEKKSGGQTTFTQYTIPVVFHVVYRVAGENVSDQQIQYALTQLNQDWSRTNTDAGNTPAVWQSIAVNTQIQFCLATKDPSGNATTGIIHKVTTVTNFSTSTSDNHIKQSANGGDDPWDVNKYLNIWICNLGSTLLGYGNFPPINANSGTVVHYVSIGSLTHPNPAGGQYGYGRTLSHEIGHCFNLFHIWGDDGGACTGSDQVTDTPNMADATTGCASGVVTDACGVGGDGSPASNAAPGRMYQNYMDYTDDQCYNMFTAGQKTRVQSAIFSFLTSVANNAATACGALGVVENSLSESISIFPNPSTGEVSVSSVLPTVNSMDLKIYNAIGEIVMTKKINVSSGETKINLNNDPNGIYLFELKTSEGTITKKIIINR